MKGTPRSEAAFSEGNPVTTWSDEQNAIFQWFEGVNSNLLIRARAGTGKTTTIIEGINRAHDRRVLLAAFNKVIAEELQSRIKRNNAEAKTLHALGFMFLRQGWPKVRVDTVKRKWSLVDKVLPSRAPQALRRIVADVHTRGRDQLVEHSAENLLNFVLDHESIISGELDELGVTPEVVANYAFDCIELAAERTEIVDFADMIFLPLRHNWTRRMYDLGVIDEAQDMNAAQLKLAQLVVKTEGRIAVVGDDRQCLYAWRGADADALDRMKRALHATELGLKTTYRCPKAVVKEAQALVPDFVAASSAPEGVVRRATGIADILSQAKVGDFVLARINAPLIPLCLRMLKAGIPARVRGADIGAGLLALCKRLERNSGAAELGDLQSAVQEWFDGIYATTYRKVAADQLEEEQGAHIINEARQRLETITALSDGLATIGELYSRFETLFSDANPNALVMFSTVHRAKGLEAGRVFLLEATFKGKRKVDGETDWQRGDGEQNIRYVAITRAKRELVWVPGELSDLDKHEG